MWLDETVGSDEAGAVGGADHLDVQVEGQEYTAGVNYDLNHDGILDSARIEHDDGSIVAYTDTDHDGQADEYLHVDASGNVLESAHFDEGSGNWVADQPHDADSGAALTSVNSGMTADINGAQVAVGAATIDSNADGHNDTAVIQDDQGNTRLFTDTDGDGKANVETVIDHTGAAVTYEHGADGQWTQSAQHPDSQQSGPPPASDQAWSSAQYGTNESSAQPDSTADQWI